jgi:WXG100 family type VII secretion target
VVSGYSVDLDKLMSFIERLAAFNTASEGIASDVDRVVAQLKATWLGAAADAHQDYHQRWMAAEQQMRDALGELKAKAHGAHGSYSGAVEHNSAMWP